MSAPAPSWPTYSELALHSIECSPKDHISQGDPFNLPDLNHRVKVYLNELTRVSENPLERSINPGEKDETTMTHMPTTIKKYDCPSCSRLDSKCFPLTVILPATSNIFEYVACIPAVSRTVQSWIQVLPWDKPADEWSKSPGARTRQWRKRHLLAAGYHMHETAQALRALPERLRRVVPGTPPLLKDLALNLANIMQELGEREEKEPGVVVTLGITMPPDEQLDDWVAKGPGSAALRRSWAEVKRFQADMWGRLFYEVMEAIDDLEFDLVMLRDMAAVVLLELETGSKSSDWKVCKRCTNNVLLVLRKTVSSLSKARAMLRADSQATADIIFGLKEGSISGPLNPGPFNASQFKDRTRQAHELAQHISDIKSRVSLWSEVMDSVQHGFREWELYGEP